MPQAQITPFGLKQKEVLQAKAMENTPQDPRYQSPELTGYLSDVLSGKYLDEQNPHLQAVIDRTTRNANAAFDEQRSNLARASLAPGRLGSAAWTSAMGQQNQQFGQGLADALAQMQYGAYNDERGFQNAAAGIQQGRDQGIWSDLTQRYGIDEQSRVAGDAQKAQARAAASAGAANWKAEQMRARQAEAQTRANFLLGMAGLGEEARQFDAGLPLQYGGLASSLLGTLGQQDLASMGITSDMMGTQMGNQLGAAGLGVQGGQIAGNLNQGFLDQQLAGVGMIPGLANADMPGLQTAGGYLSDIFGTEAGLRAAQINAGTSRYGMNLSDQLARDQLQYGSVVDQFGAGDPMSAFRQYLTGLGGISGMAGTRGENAGQYIPTQNPWLGAVQGGLGGFMAVQGLKEQGRGNG